jgi:hypothetical protein
MKIIIHIIFIITILFFSSCATPVSFQKTGTRYPLLPETSPVMVYLKKEQSFSYDKIGIVTCDGSSFFHEPALERAIVQAQTYARTYGGNCIILIDIQEASQTDFSHSSSSPILPVEQ